MRSAHARADLATGVFVTGVVLVGAGVATYLLAPRAVEVVPVATPSSVAIAVSGQF